MKDDEFIECPICEGKLEQRTLLEHPEKGAIPDVPHHVCLRCGEIFLSGEAFDIVHLYKRKGVKKKFRHSLSENQRHNPVSNRTRIATVS